MVPALCHHQGAQRRAAGCRARSRLQDVCGEVCVWLRLKLALLFDCLPAYMHTWQDHLSDPRSLQCRYTSEVHLYKPDKVISRVSDSTLFDHLDTTWEFKPGPAPNTCWLSFQTDFRFRSPLYGQVANVFFDEVRPLDPCAHCQAQHAVAYLGVPTIASSCSCSPTCISAALCGGPYPASSQLELWQ